MHRGTRDGFASSAFHSRCDGKGNTITIIKNDNNHVFGGYTSVAWHSSGSYSYDSSAYLFSLRRDKSTNSEKYLINNSQYAFYGGSSSWGVSIIKINIMEFGKIWVEIFAFFACC